MNTTSIPDLFTDCLSIRVQKLACFTKKSMMLCDKASQESGRPVFKGLTDVDHTNLGDLYG